MTARIVTFWRGDSVLEIEVKTENGGGVGRTRIPRRPEPEREALLARYLAHHLNRA